MQDFLDNPVIIIGLASSIVALFAIAYVAVVITSNRRIIEEQQKKMDEIKRSEQRYKALFENSLAGMMKFSYDPLIVFDANRTMLDMFNVENAYDLQKVLTELPKNSIQTIENAMKKSGIIESFEIEFVTTSGIKRRFFLSAKKEETENLVHAVVVLMNAEKLIG